MKGIVYDLAEAEYHAHPALSSTGARKLLESPSIFRYRQTHPEPPSTVFDVGTAAHAKVLGVGAQTVVIPDEILASNGAASTAKAKAFIAEARADGKTPVKADVAAEVDAMAEAILNQPTARVMLEQPGHREASVFGTDPDTGVAVRARFDFLPDPGPHPLAFDLKTAADATRLGFGKAIANHGYHVQRAWYLDALRFADGPELAEFLFIVVEKEPPHRVAVRRVPIEAREAGADDAREARHRYAEYLEADHWPDFPDEDTGVQFAEIPFYLLEK